MKAMTLVLSAMFSTLALGLTAPGADALPSRSKGPAKKIHRPFYGEGDETLLAGLHVVSAGREGEVMQPAVAKRKRSNQSE